MRIRFLWGASTLLTLPFLTVAASAQEATQEAWAAPASHLEKQAVAPAEGGSPFGAQALDDGKLGAIAGREDTRQAAQADQQAAVSRNSVGDNSVTGDARIADNAFQNMSGLSILNVNTGNNVAINAAMNVNISIQPGS